MEEWHLAECRSLKSKSNQPFVQLLEKQQYCIAVSLYQWIVNMNSNCIDMSVHNGRLEYCYCHDALP